MYEHSIKVYPVYKQAAQIIKQIKDGSKVPIKQLINRAARHAKRAKPLHVLVVETLQRYSQIDFLLKRSKLLDNETRLDPWLARVLITDLLWGSKTLKGASKPVKSILAYEQVFRAHVSDLHDRFQEVPSKVSKPRFVRVNTLLMSMNEAVEGFTEEGWSLVHTNANNYDEFISKVSNLRPDEFMVDVNIKELLIFPPDAHFSGHDAYKNGSIILQDKASCFPVYLLNPQPGSVVLDMCAAPGIKTSHMAAMMNNDGCIYAIDRDPERFEALNAFLEKSGATCVKTLNKDALNISKDDCPNVEYILVDPSCSGSGMVNRLELGLYDSNKTERLANLAGFQIKLLKHALRKFPTAKRIVYSTCSINPEENEHVVQEVLYSEANYALIPASEILNVRWPRFSSLEHGEVGKNCLSMRLENDCTNGFFIAVFERLEDGVQNPFFKPYFRKRSEYFENKVKTYDEIVLRKTKGDKTAQRQTTDVSYENRNWMGNCGYEVETKTHDVGDFTKNESRCDESHEKYLSYESPVIKAVIYGNKDDSKTGNVDVRSKKKKERSGDSDNQISVASHEIKENTDENGAEIASDVKEIYSKKKKKRNKSKEKQTNLSHDEIHNHENCENKSETKNCKMTERTDNQIWEKYEKAENACDMKKLYSKKKRNKSKEKQSDLSHDSQGNREENNEPKTKPQKMKEVRLKNARKSEEHKRKKTKELQNDVVVLDPKKHKKRRDDIAEAQIIEKIDKKTKRCKNTTHELDASFVDTKAKCKSKEIDLDESSRYLNPDRCKNVLEPIDESERKRRKKKKKTIEDDETKLNIDGQVVDDVMNKKRKKSKYEVERLDDVTGDDFKHKIQNDFDKKMGQLNDEDVRIANDVVNIKRKKKSKRKDARFENDVIGNDLDPSKVSNEVVNVVIDKKKKKSKCKEVRFDDVTGDDFKNRIENDFDKKKRKLNGEDERIANVSNKKKKKSKCDDVTGNDLEYKERQKGKEPAEDSTTHLENTKLLNISDFINQSKDNFIKDILTKRF